MFSCFHEFIFSFLIFFFIFAIDFLYKKAYAELKSKASMRLEAEAGYGWETGN